MHGINEYCIASIKYKKFNKNTYIALRLASKFSLPNTSAPVGHRYLPD
jgi:hypothetical protein